MDLIQTADTSSKLLATPMGFEPTDDARRFAAAEENTSPLRTDGSQTIVLRQAVLLRSLEPLDKQTPCPRCGGSQYPDLLDRDYVTCRSCGPRFVGVVLDVLRMDMPNDGLAAKRHRKPRMTTPIDDMAKAMQAATL